MTVFVAAQGNPEGDDVIGVFATREAAASACVARADENINRAQGCAYGDASEHRIVEAFKKVHTVDEGVLNHWNANTGRKYCEWYTISEYEVRDA